jgi:hypothetical protein
LTHGILAPGAILERIEVKSRLGNAMILGF